MAYKPEEDKDAKDVEQAIKQKTSGRTKVVHAPLDLRDEGNCRKLVEIHVQAHGGLDALYGFCFCFSICLIGLQGTQSRDSGGKRDHRNPDV